MWLGCAGAAELPGDYSTCADRRERKSVLTRGPGWIVWFTREKYAGRKKALHSAGASRFPASICFSLFRFPGRLVKRWIRRSSWAMIQVLQTVQPSSGTRFLWKGSLGRSY